MRVAAQHSHRQGRARVCGCVCVCVVKSLSGRRHASGSESSSLGARPPSSASTTAVSDVSSRYDTTQHALVSGPLLPAMALRTAMIANSVVSMARIGVLRVSHCQASLTTFPTLAPPTKMVTM